MQEAAEVEVPPPAPMRPADASAETMQNQEHSEKLMKLLYMKELDGGEGAAGASIAAETAALKMTPKQV